MTKRLVYHRVPENMQGTQLYPMNRLAEAFPDLYKQYKAGYEGREHLLERKIPLLDCLWNDVLHCSPVHPKVISTALKTAGVADVPPREYVEIDLDKDIDNSQAVIFYRHSDTVGDISFEPADRADWLKDVAIIPPVTLRHYKAVATGDEELFMHHGIPHVLYKGTIETANLPRIKP